MKRITLLVLVTALTAACSRKPEESKIEPIAQGTKIETVQTATVDDYYEAVGTVHAKNGSVIAARIMGNIVALHVHEGDRVRVGQTLVDIEIRDASVQLRKAEAGVLEAQESLNEVERNIHAAESGFAAARASENLARSTLGRYQTLFDRHSVSPQEFDEVRARYEVAAAESERADRMLQATKARRSQVLAQIEQARAEVASARVYSGYARLTSPINGIVVAKYADVGSMAMPGTALLTIENDADYQLEVAVEESQLDKIHLHDQARVEIDAIGSKDLACSVNEIVPAADPNSRSYVVKVGLPKISGIQLRSGLYGKARFVSGQRQLLAISQQAITQRGQLVSVFVVDQSGVARMRLIKTGKILGDRVEVLAGLNDGEQIVSEHPEVLKDGMRVREAIKTPDRIATR